MKYAGILILGLTLLLGNCSSHNKAPQTGNAGYTDTTLSTAERVELILSGMSLEEKALQMVQIERQGAIGIAGMGSVLSGGGSTPRDNTPEGWTELITRIQKNVMSGANPIPAIYGIDAVHGHANVVKSTIFPHNIGLGAANDPILMEKMGRITAREMLLTRIPWNFGPCVALAEDPRWGRTYESFSTNPEKAAVLGAAYVRGFQGAGGVATAKHYLGDGQTVWGTGNSGGIDRGDMQTTESRLRSTALIPYRALVESGVKTVMISFSSVNGEKLHGHSRLITEVLKGELGFKGFVITDWEGIHFLPGSFEDQVIAAVNAGCDMLMEPYDAKHAQAAIVKGVNSGRIPMERVDDAVRRILTVKIDCGLFEDPLLETLAADAPPLRDAESLDVARQLVEKSMVLLKNDGNLLPIRKGQTVLVMGPGANDIGLQCGGWTLTWQGQEDTNLRVTPGTTLKESLTLLSEDIGFTVITDPARAGEAGMVLLVLAEKPYAEWEGDNPAPGLTGKTAHRDNQAAMDKAASLGLPVVAVILAGRHISIEKELPAWDAAVMAYLPGTEGDGMGRVLTGLVGFSGTLPMPWYTNVGGKSVREFEVLFPEGYGLRY